jgi:hypothetical protein
MTKTLTSPKPAPTCGPGGDGAPPLAGRAGHPDETVGSTMAAMMTSALVTRMTNLRALGSSAALPLRACELQLAKLGDPEGLCSVIGLHVRDMDALRWPLRFVERGVGRGGHDYFTLHAEQGQVVFFPYARFGRYTKVARQAQLPSPEVQLASGATAPFGSAEHVADLRATVRQLEELRDNCKRGNPARATYNAQLRHLRAQLRAAVRVQGQPPFSAQEVAYRDSRGEWRRRTVKTRAAYQRLVDRLEADGRDWHTRDAEW